MAEFENYNHLHENANILDQIKINGTVYDLCDKQAQKDIEAIRKEVKGGVHYVGKTKTALTDGGTQIPEIIDWTGEEAYSPSIGDLVIVDEEAGIEFIWNGSSWDKFGSRDAVLGELGGLAFEDQVEGQLDWTHNHNFVDEDATVNVSGATAGVTVADHTYTPVGNITVEDGSMYTPEGDVTLGGLEAKSVTISGNTAEVDLGSLSYKPEGDITVTTGAPVGDEAANYTPAGTINKLTFSGKQASLTHAAHNHNLTGAVEVDVELGLDKISVGEKTHNVTVTPAEYTPEGTIAVSGGVATVKEAGTASVMGDGLLEGTTTAHQASVNGTCLEFNLGTVTVTHDGGTVDVLTGVSVEQSDITATFTGKAASIKPSVSVAAHAAYELTPTGSARADVRNTLAIADATVGAHTYTPEGTITDPVFTGTGIVIKAAFAGKQASLALGKHKHAAGALAGSVQVPTTATFAGNGVNFVFTGTQATLKHTVTQGTVSASGTYKKLKSINNAGQNSNIICK